MPETSDELVLAAHDVALAALKEITPEASIGPAADFMVEADGVVSLRFATRLEGYPGWFWTVSVARVEGEEPSVLEAELLPGEGALLAPEWVPWAERLAEYRAQQVALAEAPTAEADVDQAGLDDDASDDTDDDLDDEDLDDDDLDDDDDDDDVDEHDLVNDDDDVDGVDIDDLDDTARD